MTWMPSAILGDISSRAWSNPSRFRNLQIKNPPPRLVHRTGLYARTNLSAEQHDRFGERDP